MKAHLLIAHGKVATTVGFSSNPQAGKHFGEVKIFEKGYVLVQDEVIICVTQSFAEALSLCTADTEVIDATNQLVIPGFIDCHTHLSFAGWRDNELSLRLAGASYLDILAAGGGILSTVDKTRQASLQELTGIVKRTLDVMLSHGTTTVEAKSGYGLNISDELKQLRALKLANGSHPVDIVATFMGAHALPLEYANKREEYVRLIIEEMIPKVVDEGLAEFCDCFYEKKAFNEEETRAIMLVAKAVGLGVKIHADEITPLGGASLAAELGAISAEHLIHADNDGLKRMAEVGVIAVLL
ncbi:MAG: imidazolonepropionase, partial [bacterium]|nr:imidazolonepropionase [bacterium]